MSDYDSMDVEQLLSALVDAPHWKRVQLHPIIRRAVIREAQVGIIFIEQHEGYMSPDPMFTVGTKSKLKAGEFYLVPKETP